jgi:hypothetical protein
MSKSTIAIPEQINYLYNMSGIYCGQEGIYYGQEYITTNTQSAQ